MRASSKTHCRSNCRSNDKFLVKCLFLWLKWAYFLKPHLILRSALYVSHISIVSTKNNTKSPRSFTLQLILGLISHTFCLMLVFLSFETLILNLIIEMLLLYRPTPLIFTKRFCENNFNFYIFSKKSLWTRA